jgi:hypothetical protein
MWGKAIENAARKNPEKKDEDWHFQQCS